MKISPVSSGGIPGIDLGNASTQRTSPDRIAAAKAIAAGESPIRVTRELPPDHQVERINARKIKMRTQVSPDRQNFPIDEIDSVAEIPQVGTQSATVDDSIETAQGSEETKPLSPQFAALAKQRRAIQVKEMELRDREKALEAKAATEGSGVDLARLKSEPLRVLEEAGVTYEQLTEAILNGQSNPSSHEIKALKAELEALKTGIDTKLTDRDTQAEEQVVAEMRRDAAQIVSTGDEFKYTRAMQKSGDAARLVHEHWKQTGEIWDVTHALTLVEAECKKDYEALSSRLTPAQEQAAAQQQQQMQRPQGMRTLTNRDTARPQMSRRERMLAAFSGTLKK